MVPEYPTVGMLPDLEKRVFKDISGTYLHPGTPGRYLHMWYLGTYPGRSREM